jgi:rRNA maturation endonuclease Nob1
MKRCTSCKKKTNRNINFCSDDGARMEDIQGECAKCGNKLDHTDKFCEQCGTKVERE